jgi:hypothetical protein
VADFSQGHETLDRVFFTLKAPEVSEANVFDAVIAGLERMCPVAGRKAILLISSGVDTFSKAFLDDVFKACARSATPVYVVKVASSLPCAIRVRLVNSKTGGPLQMIERGVSRETSIAELPGLPFPATVWISQVVVTKRMTLYE